MLKQNEINEIKKLIQSGFDLELISFELDLPIEQVRQCKIELDKNNARTKSSTKKVSDESNTTEYSKISHLREKYRQLYYRSDKTEGIKQKTLSKKEMELINTVISVIEEKINEMKNLSKKEKRSIAFTILSELKKIEEYPLPMSQAEQLYRLMCSQELQELNSFAKDTIDYSINKHRNRIANKYAKAIDIEQYNSDDIEELKALERKITVQMAKENPMSVGSIKSRISSRITAKQQEQAIDRIRNNISTSIISIIKSLANGNIDIQRANEIIDEEAKKRVANKPKTKFSLNEEQERRQILIQIRTAIEEKADKFRIQNPENAVLQLQQLCGGKIEQSVRTVVMNLIEQKDFETAKRICDKFSIKNKDEKFESEHTKYMRGLKDDIRNAEIGNVVMTAINMNGTPEEEMTYFSLVEKGLKMGNVSLKAIPLGKSKDGMKRITLADIWTDEIERDKSR